MNIDLLRQKLTHAARVPGIERSIPYAFEKRVLARVRQARESQLQPVVEWAVGLWRAAVSFVALAVVLVFCSFSFPGEQSGQEDLGVALENAVLATADEALEVL